MCGTYVQKKYVQEWTAYDPNWDQLEISYPNGGKERKITIFLPITLSGENTVLHGQQRVNPGGDQGANRANPGKPGHIRGVAGSEPGKPGETRAYPGVNGSEPGKPGQTRAFPGVTVCVRWCPGEPGKPGGSRV